MTRPEPTESWLHQVELTVLGGPSDPDDLAEQGTLRRDASDLLVRSVGPDLADDRFAAAESQNDRRVIVMAQSGTIPVAAVTATSSRGRLQLDLIADVETIGEATTLDSNTAAVDLMETMIHRAIDTFHDGAAEPSSTMTVELWGRPRQDWHDELAARMGLEPHRSLHQMRCPLPLHVPSMQPKPDRTRPLNVTIDAPRLVTVNNRAFSYHPDQSDQRLDDVEAQFRIPEFEPASVRVLDTDPDDPRSVDHPMVGFCWTKIHPPRPGRDRLGEIYVIAVDPAFHGEGHGTGLTTAGLAWLSDQGLSTGMLYVESDNEPAIATYRKLGFEVHATYTAWSRP